MPTKDIKVDYGAKGDGQKVTDTVTSSLSSPTVTFGANHFTPGAGSPDIGKYIAVAPKTSGSIYDTIVGVPAANQVTLAHNAATAFAGTSQTVEWGSDDCAAFKAFRDAWAGVAGGVTLNIPDGRYCFAGTAGVSQVGFTFQITPLNVVGASLNGAIITDMMSNGRGFFIGGCLTGQFNNNTHSARAATVAAGLQTITLKTPAQTSLFSINSWALFTCIDVQAGGAPSNAQTFEYVFITAINAGTGAITVRDPLQYSYKDTYPVFSPGDGSNVDQGGPATLYALENGWDCDHTYSDIWIESPAQTNDIGRNINFLRGGCTDNIVYPTRNLTWTSTDYSATVQFIEIDKLVDTVTITRGPWRGFKFQSSSPNNMTVVGPISGIPVWQGSPKNLTITGAVTITDPAVVFGPVANGASNSVSIDGAIFSGGLAAGGGTFDPTVTSSYTMANGVLTRLLSAGALVWAVPDKYFIWYGSHGATKVSKCTALTTDGTSVFIHTNEPGGFPSVAGLNAVGTHPCTNFTMRNATGCERALVWSQAPAGIPLFSWWKKAYSGDIGTGQAAIPVFGNIKSVSFDVTTPFVGAGAAALLLYQCNVRLSDGTIGTWAPSIDLKTVGKRVVTPSGVTFNGAPGSGGSDTGLIVPDSNGTWLFEDGSVLPAVFTSMAGSSVSVTIEIVTDQGITERSFRLLLQ